MSIRYGALIIFRQGTTRQQAEEALAKIDHLIEPPNPHKKGEDSRVKDYDEAWGYPTFYIP